MIATLTALVIGLLVAKPRSGDIAGGAGSRASTRQDSRSSAPFAPESQSFPRSSSCEFLPNRIIFGRRAPTHNQLVGGSSPPSSTTQSQDWAVFLRTCKMCRIGRIRAYLRSLQRLISAARGVSVPLFSGPKIPFPGGRVATELWLKISLPLYDYQLAAQMNWAKKDHQVRLVRTPRPANGAAPRKNRYSARRALFEERRPSSARAEPAILRAIDNRPVRRLARRSPVRLHRSPAARRDAESGRA
jgi:hypothetical protein